MEHRISGESGRISGSDGRFARLGAPMVALAACVAAAACSPGVHLQPTAAPELLAKVRAACATTPYRHCEVDALEVIRSVPAYTLVVICDFGDGAGQAVTTVRENEALDNCTSGGTVPASVVAVIGVGQQ